MDPVIDLTNIIRREVADYAKGGDWKGKSYFLENPAEQVYSVVFIPDSDHPDKEPTVCLIVRVIGDYVVIDRDMTDKPLCRELLNRG
jgi:hypothetical protein